GGSNISWFQSVIEFITTSGAGNSSDPNGSYYLVPNNQWWENFTRMESAYAISSNGYKDPDVFVNPENPLIVSNWLNISFSDGNTTIYSFTRISGFMAFDGPVEAPYSAYHRDTVWFNSTTVIPHGNQINPWPFPYFYMNSMTDSGVAFVGSGSGQVVWGNYTATFGIVQDVAGNLLPLNGVGSYAFTGENSFGDDGVVILDSEYNPLGLPPYTPYTYQSNSSGGPLGTSSYNANHESAAATLIAGTISPANASVTAYAVDTHSYIPVVKNGSSFYVDYPGLRGMNSSYVIIGGLSLDYWSPVILNFSAPGFKGASVTIYPYDEMYPYIEFRIVNAILAPINEKMVYGYLSFPFSYFSYFASKYIFRVDPNIKYLTGSALIQKIWPFSVASSSYFYLNVSAGSSYFNASQYMPYITSLLLSLVWVNRTGYPSYYESSYGWAFFGSPISIPYSIVVPSSISSLNVNAPLIEGIVSVPPGSGAYEYNISLMSFNVSLTVDLSSLPESYNSTAPTVSSVSFNGKTVWSGNSTNPVFVLNIPLSQMTLYDEQPLIYNLIQGMSFEDADPYYNLTLNITPSSSQYVLLNISRNIMLFNYSLVALVQIYGENPASAVQHIAFTFPHAKVSVGGGYYAVVEGYVYGVYNVTHQKYVLSGITVYFYHNGYMIGSATTAANGFYMANISLAPASAWGYNRTILVKVRAASMQYIPYNGTIYLHPYQTEWLNVSMELISTVSILGYNYTIPAWLINAIILFALDLTDSAIIAILFYSTVYGGIILAVAAGSAVILWFTRKKIIAGRVKSELRR
ncbi:MAG: hypothetical protein QW203_07860, partial [Thermoplasmatales archaeon]